MSNDPQIQALETRIEAIISADPEHFLVEVRIKPINNIKIFIDGNQGISIEKLVQYNRRLYKQLEEENFYPSGDFSLEVSSPGLDEPLKLKRQYLKNIGRFVEVTDNEGEKIEGKLLSADEEEIVVEEKRPPVNGKNKNKEQGEMIEHMIPFTNIKTAKIQIKF